MSFDWKINNGNSNFRWDNWCEMGVVAHIFIKMIFNYAELVWDNAQIPHQHMPKISEVLILY